MSCKQPQIAIQAWHERTFLRPAGRLLLMAILLCLVYLSASTQCLADTTTPVNVAAQWQQLKNDKAFGYKNDRENIVTPKQYKPGALQKFFTAFFEFFGSRAGTTIIWLFVIFVVGFVLYKLFVSNNSFLFGRNKGAIDNSGNMPEETEDIATTNWEALLQQATANNDLRLAVRYSYMWLLQLLQQRELIGYRSDKTNYDYYLELAETQYKQPFKQLSRQYEFTWYGKFNPPASVYNEYISLFMSVKNKLRP